MQVYFDRIPFKPIIFLLPLEKVSNFTFLIIFIVFESVCFVYYLVLGFAIQFIESCRHSRPKRKLSFVSEDFTPGTLY